MKIAICGAGIVGVATAYYLSRRDRNIEITLIDKYQPLSFTTSKSGENFRNYWPQECMRQFVGHSIDLMSELGDHYGTDAFDMIYSGYNFITHRKDKSIFGVDAALPSKETLIEITDIDIIHREHPYLDRDIEKIISIKNAGRIDVYALGSLLLREAKKNGAKSNNGEILAVRKKSSHFKIVLDTKETVYADKVVIAAGPFINHIANMVGLEFPVFNTLQSKFIIPDPDHCIPRNMPFTIYADPQFLHWTKEEKEFFASEEKFAWLLQEFPGGLHIKPEGDGIKLGWAFQRKTCDASWDTPIVEFFPQAVVKGASRFIPKMERYVDNLPSPIIQYVGHYTRTKENWPLIGPTKVENVYVVGALSGYGTMGACAAGDLCAGYILEDRQLPSYANYFHPERYLDQKIKESMQGIQSDGQL